MADVKESALTQKTDCKWVRALDANGNSIRISKEDLASVVGGLMGTLMRKSIPEDANSLGIGNIVCLTNGDTKNLPPIAYESNGEGTLIQLSGSTQDYYKLQLFANPMGLRYRYFRSSWGNWSTGG